TKVIGTGNYDAIIIASPPNKDRAYNNIVGLLTAGLLDSTPIDEQLPFDTMNLDYFLISSELHGYNDIEGYHYSDKASLQVPYNQYRKNTIGYISHLITEETNGSLNSIIPICIDNVPTYVFSNTEGAFNKALYKPLVVSQELYNDLNSKDLTTGYLTIDLSYPKAQNTKGIDTQDLTMEEQALEYKAKIPISEKIGGFQYPITQVLLYSYKDNTQIGDPVEITDSIWKLDRGNLYLTRSVYDLITINTQISGKLYYKIKIEFEKIIPDTTEQTNKLALNQVTSHLIMDYFNQYTFATQTAGMIAELEYTKKLTAISTLISTPLIVLGSYLTQIGTKKLIEICAQAGNKIAMSILSKTISTQIQKMTLQQTIGLLATQMAVRTAIGTYSEILQEVVVDGVIETFIGNIVKSWGWSSELGYWLSTLATSARESKFFGLLTRNMGIDTSQQSLSYGAQIYLAQKTNTDFKSWYSALLTQSDNNALSEAQIALTNQEAIASKMSEFNIFSNEEKVPTIKKLSALFIASGLMLFLPGLSSIGSAIGIEYFSTTFLDNLDRRLMHSYQSHLYNRMSKENSILTQQKQNTAPNTKTLINRYFDGIVTLPTINIMPQINDIHKIDVVDNVIQKSGFANILKNLISKAESKVKTLNIFNNIPKIMKSKIEDSKTAKLELNILGNEQTIAKELSQTTSRKGIPIIRTVESLSAVDPIFKWKNRVIAWTFLIEGEKLTIRDAFMQIKRNLGISSIQSIILKFNDDYAISIQGSIAVSINKYNDIKKYSLDSSFNEILDDIGYNSILNSITDEDWESGVALEIEESQINILTELSQDAEEFFTEKFGYWFKNRFDILLTNNNFQVYETLYGLIQKLSKSMILTIQGMIYNHNSFDMNEGGNLNFINQLEHLLKSYWNSYFIDDKTLDTFNNNNLKEAYTIFIEKLFDNFFSKGFYNVKEKVTDEEFKEDSKDFMSIVMDRIQFTILDSIMRECGIDNPTMYYNDVTQNLNEFLEDSDKINNLYHEIHTSKGIAKFLQVFSECFINDPLNKGKLFINKHPDTYFGYTKEIEIVYSEIKTKAIEWFLEIVNLLDEDSLDIVKIYDHIKFNTKYEEINTFDLDYSDIKFYTQLSGRFLDGGGILDFITFVISTHIKSTWYESIVKADKINRRYGLVNGICDDGISAMILDFIMKISQDKNIISLPERFVNLIAPFIVKSNDETEFNADKIISTFFTKDVFNLGKKLANHEIFLLYVVDLINSEFQKNDLYISDFKNNNDLENKVKELIIDLFTSSENIIFQNKLISSCLGAFGEHSYFYTQMSKFNGLQDLSTFLTNPNNLRKLITTTSSGKLELRLVLNYNPHFKDINNEKIRISDFPDQKALYTLDKTSKDNIKKISSDNELQNLASDGELIVCHIDKYLNNRIILIPANRLNELANTEIREGYIDLNGEIHRNIFVADKDGIKLYSKLLFSETELKIRTDKNWADEFYERKEILDSNNNLKGFKTEFLAAYLIISGNSIVAKLQDTNIILEHTDPYKAPLPNVINAIKRYSSKSISDISEIYDDSLQNNPNRIFLESNSQEVVEEISKLVNFIINNKQSSKLLSIDEYILKILGANLNPNGEIIYGPGYNDIHYLLDKIIPNFGNINYETDNLVYELFSVDKRGDRANSPYMAQNMGFRFQQTRKEFLQKWYTVLKEITLTNLNPKTHNDKKIINAIFNTENINIFQNCDEIDITTDNTNLNKDEIKTAELVISKLTEIFGRFIFIGMYSGNIFPKHGYIHFLAHTLQTIHDSTVKNTLVSLRAREFNQNALMPTIRERDENALNNLARYFMDRFIAALSLKLPMKDNKLASININEVPLKLVAPYFKDSNKVRSMKNLFQSLSDYLYQSYNTIEFDTDEDSLNGRLLFYKSITEVLRNKYTPYEFNFIDRYVRKKIFSDNQLLGRSFRGEVYLWLAAHGTYSIDLQYFRSNDIITLTPDDFRQYFAENYHKMMKGFENLKFKDNLIEFNKESIIYMKDFIYSALSFIKIISKIIGNKEIIIYPIFGTTNGYYIDERSSILPTKIKLIENNINLQEWSPENNENYLEIGFLYDPNHPEKFINFIQEYLGLLLVEPSAFIVRERGMDSDECLFAFDTIGEILPEFLIKKPKVVGPPKEGMVWKNEAIFWKLADIWKSITFSNNIIGLRKLSPHTKFYELLNQIQFIRNLKNAKDLPTFIS
ncbi:MAG: hypothetical protein JXA99_03185, partial [Candidatus Lokiarchaeota archaeon]|nr:hypothetical protein [Candidatus Lokiarchaeota archaeon]